MKNNLAKESVGEDEVNSAWVTSVLGDARLKCRLLVNRIEIRDSALPCPVWIQLDPDRKDITFETYDSVDGLSAIEALLLANDANTKYGYAQFYGRGSEIHACYQLSYEDGLTARQVLATLQRFVNAFHAAAISRINGADVEEAEVSHLGVQGHGDRGAYGTAVAEPSGESPASRQSQVHRSAPSGSWRQP